jgi:hypothetical protein
MEEPEDLNRMPFVLTQEHGGEYDTEAFTAGWHLGVLDARLTLADIADLIIPPVVLRDKWKEQADLIAMARGLVLKMTPVEDFPGFSFFVFSPGESFDAEGTD